MNMEELRGKIDAVDEELLRAFTERMDIAGDIARYKAEHGLPVLDEQRERQKLFAIGEKVPEGRKLPSRLTLLKTTDGVPSSKITSELDCRLNETEPGTMDWDGR